MYLRSRAEKTIEYLGLSSERWFERFRVVQFFSTVLIFALGAVVLPFARADRLLDGEVNLAGPFVFFVLGQIFFLALSLILLLCVALSALKRKIFRQKRPLSFAEKLIAGFSGTIGTLVLIVLQKLVPWYYSLFGRKTNDRFGGWKRTRGMKTKKRDPNVADEELERARRTELAQKGAALFWNVFFSRPRFLFFWGGFLSHLFWTSCSLCVLIILCARMQGNQYDYCWRTSLEDETAVKQAIDFLGKPIELLGFVIPNEHDVARLFDHNETTVENVDVKTNAKIDESDGALARRGEDKNSAARTRARWSYFLLCLVLVWCVVPRLLLVCLYRVLFWCSLRDFRPNLNEPYFKEAISVAEEYATTTVSSFVDDPIETLNVLDSNVVLPFDNATDDSELARVDESQRQAPSQASSATTSSESVETQDESEKSDVSTLESNVEPLASNPLSKESTDFERTSLDASSQVKEELPRVPEIPLPPPPKPKIALAFGYDANLTSEQWRAVLPDSPKPVIFSDVASDFKLKKELREYVAENGAQISLCVFITDAGLSPARHYARFMKEILSSALPETIVYAVLSGGEKLRLKYGAQTHAVAERLEDWNNAINELARDSGLSVTPVFFYDADLDLPEPRARLRDLIRNGGESERLDARAARDYAKWDATTRRTLAECRAIFGDDNYRPDEEAERRRVAQVCAEIFETYQKETESAAAQGVKEITPRLNGSSLLAKVDEAASKAESVLSSAVARESLAVKDALTARCKEKGLGADFLEKRLVGAWGMSEKMRVFCSKLSPKCAIATATVGLSIPALVAFAPLLGGAATATAVATTFGALGSLLPTSVASGAAAGALGAIAPASFSLCKRKMLATFRGKSNDANVSELETRDAVADVATDETTTIAREKVASVAMLVRATTTWRVVLELQGRDEEEIMELMPKILAPIEESSLDDVAAIERALSDVRSLLPIG